MGERGCFLRPHFVNDVGEVVLLLMKHTMKDIH